MPTVEDDESGEVDLPERSAADPFVRELQDLTLSLNGLSVNIRRLAWDIQRSGSLPTIDHRRELSNWLREGGRQLMDVADKLGQ